MSSEQEVNLRFFDNPILNSPYEYPGRHWKLDEKGQPTQEIANFRRSVSHITPIPKPKKRKGKQTQGRLLLDEGKGLSDEKQQYVVQSLNAIRSEIDKWRMIEDPNQWRVTPTTARLLEHWRHHQFADIRPFFCQLEAVETAIWLTEVAPTLGKTGKDFLEELQAANEEANPGLIRLALKLATGAGKTTVMAMLIAWQTLNANRSPNSKRFTRGFLVVTPGLTIKDRLRVLKPNDPESYYKHRELVPADMLVEMNRAEIVITNYHAFKLREKMELSAGGRALLKGRHGGELNTLETEGQMLQRVMPELMGMKHILAINDEAHHCYQEKPPEEDDVELKGDDKKEAEKNNEAARLWINGLKMVNRNIGLSHVMDLSATPFFLRGSGYAEGTLFPWTVCDFSLMDAIECGIVKLPRVPVADNVSREEMPMFRDLWTHIGKKMPKKGRGKGKQGNPEDLPTPLRSALDALYGHYEKTSKLWEEADISTPPCFIIVCNNTSTSRLVYEYVSGYQRELEDGSSEFVAGKLNLFSNFDEHGNPLPRPNSLLIDSYQLESGEALDQEFLAAANDEIERFKRERIERSGDRRDGENITDTELLREVMNTVGKPGTLGGSIRCVVSVSMLTEGWDANNVTHILGVRAFGTQLLCEQVIGRALRRQCYDVNEEGLFPVEYADVFGIPFDFTAKPIVSPPQPPRESIRVKAMRPERDPLEIQFPRVEGYRVELPEEKLRAKFDPDDSVLELTPELIGASKTQNAGIIGEEVEMNLVHSRDTRTSTILMHLTKHLLEKHFRDNDGQPILSLFGQLKSIAKQWLDGYLRCRGDTYPAQLLYREMADTACQRINDAITREMAGENGVRAILDPYNPTGSTRHVAFNTTRKTRWETDPRKCHINWVIWDSEWEAEFCRILESHPKVRCFVKNHGLNFYVPYTCAGIKRRYLPDFIVKVEDGSTEGLNLIVEIKGYRGEDAKDKRAVMEAYWIPGINAAKEFGCWAFVELQDVWELEEGFNEKLAQQVDELIETTLSVNEEK